jgi:glycogen debranching enzyme
MAEQLGRAQEIVSQHAEAAGLQPTVHELRPGDGLPAYLLPGDGLSMGASLGNGHCWITTKGRGDIESFFSTDLGRIVMGGMQVRYSGLGISLLGGGDDTYRQLRPERPGTILVHPAYQQQTFELEGKLQVRQTIFVPKVAHAHECAPAHPDRAVACQRVQIANQGDERQTIRVYGFAQFRGDTPPDIQAHYDAAHGVLLAANAGQPNWVRVFGATMPVSAYETSTNAYQVYPLLRMQPLHNRTEASGGYVMGGLQVDLELAPGEQREVTFVAGFSAQGEQAAVETFEAARAVETALQQTVAFYAQSVKPAEVLTPDAIINAGALWAKVNMLRVMADYPTGPAFTNDPSRSSAVVGRDAFWFVCGADHLVEGFSCHLLRNFASRQDPTGKIMEFYHAVTGAGEDNDLNINDNTPLFILAVNHHWRSTGHRGCLEEFYPAVVKAARRIISQEDARGLVWCTSTGEDVRGIIGWRNIIPHYRISGAVTEVNAECAAALRAVGHLAENLGHQEEAREFGAAAARLTEAINRHLLDGDTRFYYLNIDVDGSVRTDVTADEVFPVIFRVAPDDVAFNIVRRINYGDFWTEAGIRTASTASAEYDPSGRWGLVGGVWPGVTWWYAFAAARYYPDVMARALRLSFAHYARSPREHNTVPGQFSEWFDGDSLVNRGMRLSPWEAPRYLWAAVEGLCGVSLRPAPEGPSVQPSLPPQWRWVGLRALPYHGRHFSYFAARMSPGGPAAQPSAGEQSGAQPLRLFATAALTSANGTPVEEYTSDVTDRVGVIDEALRVVAFERSGEVVICVGNTAQETTIGALELGGVLGTSEQFSVQLYDSELGGWVDLQGRNQAQLRRMVLNIEAQGFRIVRLSAATA